MCLAINITIHKYYCNRGIELFCFDGVVIAAQCTATFFKDLSCSPNLGITNVNMPVKFCSEAYSFRLEVN